MDFASTYRLESTALPGVTVTLKRMGPRRRAEVELLVSSARAKQREISVRHETIRQKLLVAIAASPKDAEGKPIEAELAPETLALGMDLQAAADEAAALVRAQIHPAFVKAALKSFSGPEALTYEGKAATAELLCDCGPDDLFDEVVAAVNSNGYLAVEKAENFASPSISATRADGAAKSMTAPAASLNDSSLPEAA